ncbi:hypothetical protein [Streptomyces canus]|uniref:hypothetical protein n=1 Tax=Streptomyces canus TaxID=58343 RepID=UPI00352EB3D8
MPIAVNEAPPCSQPSGRGANGMSSRQSTTDRNRSSALPYRSLARLVSSGTPPVSTSNVTAPLRTVRPTGRRPTARYRSSTSVRPIATTRRPPREAIQRSAAYISRGAAEVVRQRGSTVRMRTSNTSSPSSAGTSSRVRYLSSPNRPSQGGVRLTKPMRTAPRAATR